MKLFFKTLLPWIAIIFVNEYGCHYAFAGMTAPHDITFIGGVILIAVLLVVDYSFVTWRVKRATRLTQITEKSKERKSEDAANS